MRRVRRGTLLFAAVFVVLLLSLGIFWIVWVERGADCVPPDCFSMRALPSPPQMKVVKPPPLTGSPGQAPPPITRP